MIKRTLLIVIGTLLMAISSFAQDSTTWSAYLLDNINYDLIRVDADGTTAAFSLDLAEGEYLSLNDISISQNGQLAAFCKSAQAELDQATGIKTLIIREIATGNDLLTIPFGEAVACSVTAFSEDDSMIALSLVHYQAFETVEDGQARWSLHLLNVADGALRGSLQEGDGIMPAFTDFGEDVPLLAIVSQFDTDSITFTGIPFLGMGGPEYLPVYRWDLADNAVTRLTQEFGRLNNDYLPATGELVYPALDENLVAAQPEGPLPQANVVNVMEADGSVHTIYQNEHWVIVEAQFINNGESIAVTLLPGFGMGQEMPNALHFEIINRDGTLQSIEQGFDGGTWIGNIPDGTVIVHTPNPTGDAQGATQIFVWDGNTLNQISEYLPNYDNGWSPPQLLWVTPFTAPAELPSFTPIS